MGGGEKKEFNKFVKLKTTMEPAFVPVVNDLFGNSEKYKWHDLRKNPEDLPEESALVLAFFKHFYSEIDKYREYNFAYYSVETGWIYNQYYEIIAWRYIEPFEEEEQND